MTLDLRLTCVSCDGDLEPGDRKLSMRTPEGLRHAYECDCGAITITIDAERAPIAGEAAPGRE